MLYSEKKILLFVIFIFWEIATIFVADPILFFLSAPEEVEIDNLTNTNFYFHKKIKLNSLKNADFSNLTFGEFTYLPLKNSKNKTVAVLITDNFTDLALMQNNQKLIFYKPFWNVFALPENLKFLKTENPNIIFLVNLRSYKTFFLTYIIGFTMLFIFTWFYLKSKT